MQMVRARPHIGKDQRPEMHHRQTVRVDRTLSLFRHEVIHHAEKTGGQEKAHRIVPVPPLDHRILHPGVRRVGLGQRHRDRRAINDVQQRHGQNKATVKPVGHVDMRHLALDDRPEKHYRISYPNDGNQNVDRPFQLGVFLALRKPQRQSDGGQHNHRLPAPEHQRRQRVGKEPRVAGSLHHVERTSHQGTTTKGKNHRVGMQGAQASEMQKTDIEFRPDQLRGDDDTDEHADNTPDHGHDGKLAHNLIVVR